jgi:type IV pilus assembly protein PilA
MNLSTYIHNPITAYRGFTLMELMVTVAIVAILATIFIPSNLIHRQRSEVSEAVTLAKSLRENITLYYINKHSFPADNSEAGLPAPDLLIGNKVTRIEVEDGAIHITLGNNVSKPLQDKMLSIRPAIVTGSPASPISWLCGPDKPVKGMEAVGINKTNIDNAIVPASCTN